MEWTREEKALLENILLAVHKHPKLLLEHKFSVTQTCRIIQKILRGNPLFESEKEFIFGFKQLYTDIQEQIRIARTFHDFDAERIIEILYQVQNVIKQ